MRRKFCYYHVECKEDIENDTWTCSAHLDEGRAFQCPYNCFKDAKSGKYPCVDCEKSTGRKKV